MRSVSPTQLATLSSALWLCAACGGEVVVLGDTEPPATHFGPATLVGELGVPATHGENATLTADMREMYFTSARPPSTTGDVWRAKRASATASFDAPELVAELNTASFETSPAISSDGLTLWFGSDRLVAQHVAIFVSKRASRTAAFGPAEPVSELNSALNDVPRPLGQRGNVMPMSSERATPDWYSTYLTRRDPNTGAFSAPEPVRELFFSDRSSADAFLSDDGLRLFFASGPPMGPADLYVAFRKSESAPFSVIQALTDLNSVADERDPFLASDGVHFYFTSDRDGVLAIYQAELLKARSAN